MDRITISVSDDVGNSLKSYAKTRGESVSRIASNAITHYLEMMRRKKLGMKVLGMIRDSEVSPTAIDELDSGRADCDSRI